MATYAKWALSGSTNGKQIEVAAVGPTGTVIHTAGAGTTNWDEVWLWCVNASTLPVKLTVEWGGTVPNDDYIESTIPAESGLQLIIPGLILQNSLIVRAFAGTANVLEVSGFVNRISP